MNAQNIYFMAVADPKTVGKERLIILHIVMKNQKNLLLRCLRVILSLCNI